MPCRFASSGTVATSRSASRAILALNVASNFLRDLVISVLHPLRQSRTLHTLTFGPISGVHFTIRYPVAIGKLDDQWDGVQTITAKRENPRWFPSEDIQWEMGVQPMVPPGPQN